MEMEMLRTQTFSAITATKRVTRGLIAFSLRLGQIRKTKNRVCYLPMSVLNLI